MPNTFTIWCHPRTGSYHVSALLGSCSDVICHGEIFKADAYELEPWHKSRMRETFGSLRERDENPAAYVQRLRELNPWKHFGFKMFYSHCERVPYLFELMESWRRIVIFREPVAVYTSLTRADQTGIWTYRVAERGVRRKGDRTVYVGDDREARLQEPVRFEPESFEAFWSRYASFLQICMRLSERDDTFLLPYSRINDPGLHESLKAFVGSTDPNPLDSSHERQFHGELLTGIANPEELVAYLRASSALSRDRAVRDFLEAHGELLGEYA
jgi:hypothetical protein